MRYVSLLSLAQTFVLVFNPSSLLFPPASGTSVGGFVYATLQNELIELYGLNGCLLIIGALALNLMACAGPMRPLYLPGYLVRQRAVLKQQEEPPMYEKPTTLIIAPEKPASDIQTIHGSAEKSNGTVKELLIGMDTKVLVDYEAEAGRRAGFLSCSAVVRVIKRTMRPYAKYLHETGEFMHDRVFTMFCVSVFMFALGAFPPVLFMEDVALSEGLIEGVSIIPLVSIVAITSGAGKLLLGIMADLPWINSIYLYAFTLLGSGAALLLIPMCKSYVGLQVLSAMVGVFSGNWSLTSYITTQIVGLERLSQAHGIVMCFGGFGIVLGPPVVGEQTHHLCCVGMSGIEREKEFFLQCNLY